MRYVVHPSQLHGAITVPSSKSHTLRAILFASIAKGTSEIDSYLESTDQITMIMACRQLGAKIIKDGKKLIITGIAGQFKTLDNVVDAGNSGIVLRFIGALCGLMDGYTVITGDESIRHRRPAQPLIDGINQLGGKAVSTKNDGKAPLIIKGKMRSGLCRIDGQDSQPVSGLLIASTLLEGSTTIHVQNPGETPWVDMTLQWLRRFGAQVDCENYSKYVIQGNIQYNCFNTIVPGAFCSASFPLVAAVITGSELTLNNLDVHDCQGDKKIIDLLQAMGSNIEIDSKNKRVHVLKGPGLKGIKIDINECIDALPILAVLGCCAEGETQLINGTIARSKESDRIHSMALMLKKMGAHIVENFDGLTIKPSKLKGAVVESFKDHRIALALSVAGLVAEGETVIEGVECVDKTYPQFADEMRQQGANLWSQ
ncbi:MAG: 3-phosphoshikimate 1-carboxyvinyltransferase [Parachlamydiales bacterium]|nr:3-phosphoshikimate 1-carboxyvinyltransferase [Parachlamydiales bacterium]